ncbi:hypothetical protein CEUSTIGMA_g12791.t1 [Chlamydomonas eustigma]|uniref:Uncharacterized protein n=1 Tax=Chlamydomonas eustigma TaxID=1157962 RepID=A0A250XQP1_9CHLO|nr:hypothetical protein CEUSTIGMA_g12791.t1 [Chlamydomonas eustigma]|eukprot:GAX85374.1 hypothetical protein CEUSTIGMA_g12791.t1 [Chlamydomonas eustigma]
MQEPLSPEEEAKRTLQFLVEENAILHQIVASIENKSGVALATASVASETLNKTVAPGIGPQQFPPAALPSSLKLKPALLTPFEVERGSIEDVDAWLFKAESMFAMCGVTDENICIDEYAGQALIGNATSAESPLFRVILLALLAQDASHGGTVLQDLSISRMPTDGQTENANRTVEDIIRAYVILPYHDDWDEHLITSCEFTMTQNTLAIIGSHRSTWLTVIIPEFL